MRPHEWDKKLMPDHVEITEWCSNEEANSEDGEGAWNQL